MPEIGEVARAAHFLRERLIGKTLAVVKATDDQYVYGKVGTSAAEFENAMRGKKVLSVGQQGKYFWLIMSSPPHPVMHLGMTGWVQIHGEHTFYYKDKKEEVNLEWPPKHWKFLLETAEEPKIELAFTDPRRFGRIRLVDCNAEDIRSTTPLKENGPDPVIDRESLTEEWLAAKMNSKHVPVKALLLDQANISGIGNWVGDEILYNAKLHPEQYSDTFSPTQVKQLLTSILYVCQLAVDVLGDSEKFPKDWLFKYRWGKGDKSSKAELPNGAKMTYIKVGGRTSCVVPSVQKKTGAVAGDVPSSTSWREMGSTRPLKHGTDINEEDWDAKPKNKKRKVDPAPKQMNEAIPVPATAENEEIKDVKPKSEKQKISALPTEAKKVRANGVVKTKSDRKPTKELNGVGRRRSGRFAKGEA